MPLVAGSRVDSYEIVTLLGAGGMGEVYRARDISLKREVAIKVLPEFCSRDPDRLRRFELEAQAAAALNHPDIVTVFHFGRHNGAPYIVTELLHGESLRDRLRHGPMRLGEVLDLGIEIARGLAAAHGKGIVHRDLKPENLFLTRDGRLKILDFGIAKLVGVGGEQTITPGTTPGMVLGTVGYMSPEQVRGLPADHRTDIFSSGAIVYEMLSGRRSFAGGTPADTMSSILNAAPAEMIDAAHPVPAMLDRFVRRCVEKNPEERFQSARDIAFNLDAISTTTGHSTGGVAALDVPARLPRAWVVAALALGLTVGAAAAWVAAVRTRSTPAAATFQQLTFRRGTITAARFSPNGETIL